MWTTGHDWTLFSSGVERTHGVSPWSVDQSGDRCADLGSEDGEIDVHFAEEEIEKRNEIETEIERGKDSFWRQLVGATGPETRVYSFGAPSLEPDGETRKEKETVSSPGPSWGRGEAPVPWTWNTMPDLSGRSHSWGPHTCCTYGATTSPQNEGLRLARRLTSVRPPPFLVSR